MSGLEFDVGQAGDEGDREAAEDEDDRRRDLAEVGEADQQGRREEQDEDRLDVVHAHITSGAVDELLSPPLEDVDHIRGERGAPLRAGHVRRLPVPLLPRRPVDPAPGPRAPRRRGSSSPSATCRSPSATRWRRSPPRPARRRRRRAASGSTTTPSSRTSRGSRARRWSSWRAELGLDAERFAAELDSGAHRERIARDVASAEASGATGTPTFFVNGKRLYGAYDAGSLVEALEGG